MSKTNKLVERFLTRPKDLSWDELVKVLAYYGYSELKTGKTGGSRRRFADIEKNVIALHKPHPSTIVKSYVITQILEHLNERGKIENE